MLEGSPIANRTARLGAIDAPRRVAKGDNEIGLPLARYGWAVSLTIAQPESHVQPIGLRYTFYASR